MTHTNSYRETTNIHSLGIRSAEFNARIEEGLRRAPAERAKAVRDFWSWIVSRG